MGLSLDFRLARLGRSYRGVFWNLSSMVSKKLFKAIVVVIQNTFIFVLGFWVKPLDYIWMKCKYLVISFYFARLRVIKKVENYWLLVELTGIWLDENKFQKEVDNSIVCDHTVKDFFMIMNRVCIIKTWFFIVKTRYMSNVFQWVIGMQCFLVKSVHTYVIQSIF